MKEVFILGRPMQLQERKKAEMKGITIGDSLMYRFYDGEFHGIPLLFAEPKGKLATPHSLSVTAGNLTSLPISFTLSFADRESHGIGSP